VSDSGIKGFHLVRYGTPADQKYLARPFLATYDQLVVNANMVAHTPGAIASFILQHMQSKPYFIDPQTHSFQHDISHIESRSEKSAGQIKRSVRKMIESYGEPIKTVVGRNRRSLLPSHLSDGKVVRQFCQRVINFQLEAISAEAEQDEDAKYYRFVREKKKLGKVNFGPSMAIAPYFCMTPATFKDWLKVNIDCATCSLESDEKIGIQVVITRDLLVEPTMCEQLVKAYAKLKPASFLIWVDGFSEHKAALHQLVAFVDLLKQLGDCAPVVNLYGGFLSVALRRCGKVDTLAGVAHGLEYGESREVVPVGGGLPIAKFYYPAMHKRVPFREALRVTKNEGGLKSVAAFHRTVCDCEECKSVIRSDAVSDFEAYGRTHPVSFMRRNQPIAMEYPLPETKDHCVRHYMWCKEREYDIGLSQDKIIDDLKWTERLAGTLDLDTVTYAKTWQLVLGKKRR